MNTLRLAPLVVLLLGFACPAPAQDWIVAERTLAELSGDARPLRLEFQHAQRSLALPLSRRVEPLSLTLRLKVTRSIALVPERSQLVVRLNGTAVEQVPVVAGRPVAVQDIALPVALLEDGYNELRFEGIQHYPTNCEVGEPPESWQEIDALETRLTLEYRERPVPAGVGRLDDVFDQRLWAPRPLTVHTAAGDASLNAAGIAARGAALRYRFHPLAIGHATLSPGAGDDPRLPGLSPRPGDRLVVGTAKALAGSVDAALLARVNGAFLGLYGSGAGASDAVVLISGRNDAEVERAARAFALARGLPLPDGEALLVDALDLSPAGRDAGLRGLVPGGRYAFESLGLATTTLAADPARLEFSLPADVYAAERDEVELRLHLAYAAGMSADSALSVALNGQFAAAVPLTNVRGERFVDYRLRLPLRVFRPGRNVLQFEAVVRSAVPGECAPRGSRFPITLHGDSEISIPVAGRLVELPDLGLFGETGFPLGADPEGRGAALHVVDTASDTLAAALTLAGKLAQVRGTALQDMKLASGLAELPAGSDVLIVAPPGALPPRLREASPIDLGGPLRVTQSRELLPPPATEGGEPWWRRLLGLTAQPPARLGPDLLLEWNGRPSAEFSGAALMQFAAPDGDGSVVLFTARPGELAAGAAALVDFRRWNLLAGDLAVWRDGDDLVTARGGGRRWHIGDASLATRADYRFSRSPWQFAATAGLLLALFAGLGWWLLQRRRQRRTAAGENGEY